MQQVRAIELYLTGEQPVKKIVQWTGISKTELYRMVHRAFEARADGLPIGYLACIPGYRIKNYQLTSSSPKQKAGKINQFFSKHPELKEQLDAWALGNPCHARQNCKGNILATNRWRNTAKVQSRLVDISKDRYISLELYRAASKKTNAEIQWGDRFIAHYNVGKEENGVGGFVNCSLHFFTNRRAGEGASWNLIAAPRETVIAGESIFDMIDKQFGSDFHFEHL